MNKQPTLEKSKIPTKGLTRITKDKGGHYEKGADLLYCDGKIISTILIDMQHGNRMSWLPMALVFFVCGCFILFIGIDPEAEPGVLYIALSLIAVTGPSSYFLLKLRKKGPQHGNIIFNRESGIVSFSSYLKTGAFEVPFDMLNLHIVKFSAGKGVMFYQPYLTPSHFPEGIGKHIRYEAPFQINSEQEAEYLWGAYATFMDKSKPIPFHFYRFLQALVNNGDPAGSQLKIYDDIKQQAPFYDDKTERVIKKEVW